MKKLLLSFVFVILSVVIVRANTVVVYNYTSCTLMASVNGGIGYDSIPPYNGFPVTWNSSAPYIIDMVKIYWDVGGLLQQINAGYFNPVGDSSGLLQPLCLSTSIFNFTWSQANPTVNAVLVIW